MKNIIFFLIFLSSISNAADTTSTTDGYGYWVNSSARSAGISPNSTKSGACIAYQNYVNSPSGQFCDIVANACAFSTSTASCSDHWSDWTRPYNVSWISTTSATPGNETCTIADPLDGHCAEICEDGFYDYESRDAGITELATCDRSAIYECPDLTLVSDLNSCHDTSIPDPTSVCTDYDTCFNYVFNNSSCDGPTYFEFNYTNPQNFDFTCTVISDDSPDNASNGGNQDGNPNNDPTSPDTPMVSEIDPQTLSTAIDSALQDDFGNVERAIRETSSNVEDVLIDGFSTADQNAQSIKDALNNGSSDIVDSVDGVKNSVNSGNATLAEISGKLDELKECEPTPENKYCENPHGLDASYVVSITDAIQGTFNQEKTDAVNAVKGEIEELKNTSPFSNDLSQTELTSVWSYFTDIWPSPSSCIPLTFGDGSKPWSITITCEFSDKFKAIFSFLISIYTVLQLVDILFSGIRPKPLINS
jgi:hypothetical protein